MQFTQTELPGAWIIDLDKREDERGFFARTWCRREFEAHGLVTEFVQGNLSLSRKRGTLRGMHYQAAPDEETKLVRCTRGAVYDVIVDLRAESPAFGRWIGVELSAANYRTLYVPGGFAHGFLTLGDDCEVSYQVSQYYAPASERGVRFDDPAFGIVWPQPVRVISAKDRSWPDFALAGR